MAGISVRDISGFVYDLTKAFEIDELIRTLALNTDGRLPKLQQKWNGNVELALGFGRRMMDVAWAQVEGAKQAYMTDTIEDWTQLATLSGTAQDATQRVMKHLLPPHLRFQNFVDGDGAVVPLVKRIGQPLHQIRFRKALAEGQRLDPAKSWAKGEADAKLLIDALELLSLLATESDRRRRSVSAVHVNPGEPEKRAFAQTMLAGWIFLTGKKASHNNITFQSFVGECWKDLRIESDDELADHTSWEHSIRVAGEEIDEIRVTELAVDGPDWK
jgi:hypothetical protein